jgi:aspartate/methionine/tyrosine aminotransferase
LQRYSDRLAALAAAENQFSRLLAQSRASGRALLDLTVSNPTEALVDYPHAEIASALGAIENFRYQPEPFGNFRARAAIARRQGVSAENLALTASTSEAYGLLFKLLANPGDEILVPAPSYPLFEYLAQLEAVRLRPYRLGYDGSWFIDFASLAAGVGGRTRAVILVNPNNPTGSFLRVSEYERLREFGLPLISDEVFRDYAFGESASRVTSLNGRRDVLSFTLNGLSKMAGMPQMKLGWMHINGPDGECRQARERLELILDTYLSVGAPVQLAAEALLAVGDGIQAKIRARILKNLAAVDELTAHSPVHRLHSESGWSIILRVPRALSEEEWITRLLMEQGVVVQPGYFFDMPGEAYLVASLLTPEESFREGVVRIQSMATRQ